MTIQEWKQRKDEEAAIEEALYKESLCLLVVVGIMLLGVVSILGGCWN